MHNIFKAFIQERNVFVYDAFTGFLDQITTDGSEETAILNGINGWVYEEEVFSASCVLWSCSYCCTF